MGLFTYKAFEGIDNVPVSNVFAKGFGLWGLPAGPAPPTSFARLECLDLVFARSCVEIEVLATLTRLTLLTLKTDASLETRDLIPLSRLTSLQELNLNVFEKLVMIDFWLVVSPMARLRKLELAPSNKRQPFGHHNLADMNFLLSALPAVTSLALGAPYHIVQWSLEPFEVSAFARLRELSLFLLGTPEQVARLAKALPELEALTFAGDCMSFLSHLHSTRDLTKLKAGLADWPGIRNVPHVPGNVLARFKSLQQLRLHGVLDMKQWNEDVKSLAVLTDSRILDVTMRS
jgi:hypothetical protein